MTATQGKSHLQFEITSFGNGDPIPDQYAFCNPAEEGHVSMGENKNPHLKWSEVPDGTKSFAIICVDPDAPTVPDDANQEGKSIPEDLPRTDFYHWDLVDIPSNVREIKTGEVSKGIIPGGKEYGESKYGVQGLNNYTEWFEADEDMMGEYAGYDGPCPPWNDERVHRYYFRLFALEVESVGLSGPFTGPEALQAIEGHILDQAEWMGTYTLNPEI